MKTDSLVIEKINNCNYVIKESNLDNPFWDGDRQQYIGYPLKEAVKQFRQRNNLVGKKLTTIKICF